MKPIAKALLIGCGALVVVVFVAAAIFAVWLFNQPEGGVMVGNEMEQYALDHIAEHDLLGPDEEILAYYDVTLALDGSEAALLTPERVVYLKNGTTTSIPLEEIEDVRHWNESFIGDIFEIQAESGQIMKIEVAPLNGGKTFENALMAAWEKTQETE